VAMWVPTEIEDVFWQEVAHGKQKIW